MIKYRQLCFCVAVFIATSSVGLAQTTPGQPAAAPADAPAISKAVTPATPVAASDPAQPAPNSRATTTSKQTNSTQNANSSADPTEPARRIAIIELSPDTEKSEVIRQVVEILEKQGVAKQSTRGAASTGSSDGIEARIRARADTKSEDVISLVRSLQGHGVQRMSFAMPSDNRNVVTVLAPADTPWPVIDNLRIMVTAKKLFAVDVQIANPARAATSYNSGSRSRYGYSATTAAGSQSTDRPAKETGEYNSGRLNGTDANSSKPSTKKVPETRVFMLRYADAKVVAQTLSELFSEGFGIAPDANINAIIVRGDASQLKEVETILELVDGESGNKTAVVGQAPKVKRAAGESTKRDQKQRVTVDVDVPLVTADTVRSRITGLDLVIRQTADSLRAVETAAGEATDNKAKGRAELREVVRKTFLARQELQRAELAEFAARLDRIQQSIELRDRIADEIIDRRVEELLDPNLKWDHNETGGTQKPVLRNETVNRQQRNNGQQQQWAPASSNQHVTVTSVSNGTAIHRKSDYPYPTVVAVNGNCQSIGPPEPIEVFRSLEDQKGLKPRTLFSIYETNESSVRVVVEPVYHKQLPVRHYPMIGLASLHLLRHRCTVYFKVTPGVEWPLKKDGLLELETIFYMDSDHLHPMEGEKKDALPR